MPFYLCMQVHRHQKTSWTSVSVNTLHGVLLHVAYGGMAATTFLLMRAAAVL
ncbi:hypothetical protein EJ08DRAFT_651748 [Tothia fuscella]|uniref:Uncharacterized protein n=1 Tax=Tothia fuscella TaxID=1048955 RepID=A0A9P4TW06_9PEZI|nr:hypothetical protein EJ08DRAFT_651748 [Tothia fuscella]